jgi:leader peptidase (prepilin peptidase) / N-methyltransferase
MNSAADENAPHPNAIQALMAVPSSRAFGDARLAGPVASALGWWGAATVLLGIVAGFVLAGLISLLIVAAGRRAGGAAVPMGAFLAAGAALTAWSFH